MEFRRVDMKTLIQRQLQEITNLENEGLLDANFRQCYSLKEDGGLLFLLDLIKVFLTDVHTVVNEMTRALAKPAVDFNTMYCQCIKIKGSSACFGARRLSDACAHLRGAIDNKSREGCLQALESIKHQYGILAKRLDAIVTIEHVIVARRS